MPDETPKQPEMQEAVLVREDKPQIYYTKQKCHDKCKTIVQAKCHFDMSQMEHSFQGCTVGRCYLGHGNNRLYRQVNNTYYSVVI
jgi:hypothetical protein